MATEAETSANKAPASRRSLADLLRDVHAARRTGLLSFVRGADRLSVRFVNGQIVSAVSGLPRLRMGECMVRAGMIEPSDLACALEVLRVVRKRLGVVLRDMGVVDEARLARAVRLHVFEVLSEAFAWADARHSFVEDEHDAPREDLCLELNGGELILEAVRKVGARGPIRGGLGDLDRVFGPASGPLLRYQHLALTPAEAFVLSRVDGGLSLRELIEVIPMEATEVERCLFGLIAMGFIEARGAKPRVSPALRAARQAIEEAFEGVSRKSHFEVLGVTPESTAAEVKAAYLRQAKRFHPDTLADASFADLRSRIVAVFERICSAYKILSQPESRARYEAGLRGDALPEPSPKRPRPDETQPLPRGKVPRVPTPAPAPQAETRSCSDEYRVADLLSHAQAQLAEGRAWEVKKTLEGVLPVAKGRGLLRARLLLAQALVQNRELREAELQLLEVLGADPGHVDALFVLAALYRELGLKQRAVVLLKKILGVRPHHKGAQAELEALLSTALEPPTRSLLEKVLGKAS